MILAGSASAQTVLIQTNEAGMGAASGELYALAGSVRLNLVVLDGGSRKNLSAATNIDIRIWNLTDESLGGKKLLVYTGQRLTTEVYNPAEGDIRYSISSLPAARYEVQCRVVAFDTNNNYNIHWGYLTLTNSPSSVGNTYLTNNITLGAVTVGVSIAAGAVVVTNSTSLTVTNNTTINNTVPTPTNVITIGSTTVSNIINNSVSNYINASVTIPGLTVNVAGITFEMANLLSTGISSGYVAVAQGDGTVKAQPASTTGSGGITNINGQGGPVFSINTQYPLTSTTTNNTLTLGIGSTSGGLVVSPWTNLTLISYLSNTAQFYVCSATATQVFIECWGGSAGYSPGGYASGYLTVTGSEVLSCYVAQGGLSVSNATAVGGWPGGSAAQSTNATTAVSGGGWTFVAVATNIVIGAGGGGGSKHLTGVASGGGSSGYSTGTASSGGGGTQSAGGAGATSAGSGSTNGGISGVTGTGTNNTAGGVNPGNGGGGGFFGGGGGVGASGITAGQTSGGGGSGFIGGVSFGTLLKGATDSQNPPATDSTGWQSPWGVGAGANAVTNNARSNSGGIAIRIPNT